MKLGCPIAIEVVYVWMFNKLVIKKLTTAHNHPTSNELFNTLYPKNRIHVIKHEDSPDQLLMETKLKNFKVYMEKQYKNFPTPKDASNLKAKFNIGSKIDDSLNSIVDEFTGQYGNIFHIGINEFE